MYSLDGIPLDNATYGWKLLDASSPLLSHSVERERLTIPGRDGTVPLPGTTTAPVVRLLVETPLGNAEALLALAASDPTLRRTTNLPDSATVQVATEFLGSSPVPVGEADELIEIEILLNVPGAFWRSASFVTLGPFSLVDASQSISVFTGISAPVQDALVRVKGACTGLRVTDGAGASYFDYAGTLTSTQYLRFESATGRAYVTTSDVWSGGTEVSGDIDYDGPRGVFEITPSFDTDPTSRGGVIIVDTATRTSAQVSVRGRGAYRGI